MWRSQLLRENRHFPLGVALDVHTVLQQVSWRARCFECWRSIMFGKGIRLPFTLAGIPVYLDVSFLLILPLMAWAIASRVGFLAHAWHLANAHSLEVGAMPYVLGFVAAVGLFVCVVLHELGHSLVARAFGVRVRSITLWFLGGVARFEQMPRKAGAEALVAIAGPIVSVTLAALFFAGLLVLPLATPLVFILGYLTVTNFFLAIFNLIPAIPLDGGRVLRSLLALFLNYSTATRVAATVSKILAVLMALMGIVAGQWYLIIVALFVFMAGSAETRAAYVEELLHGARVADAMNSQVETVSPQLSVNELSQKVMQEHHGTFPVVDEKQNLVGVVSMRDLTQHPEGARVSDIMSRQVPTVGPGDDAYTALQRMDEVGADLLAVTDGTRHLLGVLTRMDFMRLMELRSLTVRFFSLRPSAT
jgi:Zn-dependent protease